MNNKNLSDKPSIWISGASGVLGYGILRALDVLRSQYRLIGTTCFENSAAPAFCDICITTIPRTDEAYYLDWIKIFIKKYHIVMAIPGLECDNQFWSLHDFPARFPSVCFLLNNPSLISLSADKWIFYLHLLAKKPEYAIPTYVTCEPKELPKSFILKPRNGYGSKGTYYGSSWLEYTNLLSFCDVPMIIQPLIGSSSAEYTLSAFFDKNSIPLRSLLLRRLLSKQGFTEYAEVSSLDTQAFLSDMSSVFYPIGPTNFQFRIQNDQIKLLEINPRLSSATSIRAKLGYNEAQLSVEYFLENKELPIHYTHAESGTRIVRYYEDIILE